MQPRTSFRPFIVSALALAVVSFLAKVLPIYYTGLLTQMLIFGIFAMSLNLLLGYTGLPSFGHAAYFGAAAYTTAIFSLRVINNFWVDGLAGLMASVMSAALFGLLALRTSGAYFLMITLAIAQVLAGVAVGWEDVTGGTDGLPGILRPKLGAIFPWSLTDGATFFYFTLIIFVIVAGAIYVLVRSPFGYALQGIRENESRMRALGYNVWLYKYVAFIAAGFFAGIGGVLFVYYNSFVNTSALGIPLSGEGLLMVVLGGAGTFLGPVIGAGSLVFLRYTISAYTERWELVLGVIFVLVVLFAPRGIMGTMRTRSQKMEK